MPSWALTIAFWLHMTATVAWIGGLFFHAFVLTPAIGRGLSPEGHASLLSALRRRFNPVAWISLTVLVATGLMQMSASPHYQGFFSISNRWSAAILTKHLTTLVMICLAGYQTWFLQPQMERMALLRARSRASSRDAVQMSHRQTQLARINLTLGVLVLALTAIARTAPG